MALGLHVVGSAIVLRTVVLRTVGRSSCNRGHVFTPLLISRGEVSVAGFKTTNGRLIGRVYHFLSSK